MEKDLKIRIIGNIIGFLLITAGLMWLWNGFIPIILMLPEISYLQSMGLYVMSNLFFRKDKRVGDAIADLKKQKQK